MMEMHAKQMMIRSATASLFAMASYSALAQTGQLSGEAEDYIIGLNKSKSTVVTDRASRFKLAYSTNHFEATIAYYMTPLFHSQSMNETWLGYKNGNLKARIGQLMLPIGQSNWDDQWYDGSNSLPMAEVYPFIKGSVLAMTTPGADLEYTKDRDNLRVAAIHAGAIKNKPFADSYDIAAARFQHFDGKTIVGFSTALDLRNNGRDAKLYCIDGRWTSPHWIVRGEYLWSARPSDRSQGGFFTITHRPAGWSDASLFFRFQVAKLKAFFTYDQREIIGVKLRLPLDFSMTINYTIGPDMYKFTSYAGTSIQLYRVYRF